MSTPYYEDDLVTLYHGDCREITGWLDADVLVTDPPYGVRCESSKGDKLGPRSNRITTTDVMANDTDVSTRDDALQAWGDRPAIVFGSWRMPRPARLHALLIWNKEGAYYSPSAAAFFTNHEEIYALGKGWPVPDRPLRSVITTTEHRSVHTAQIGHPTPKPLGLMERLIEACPPGTLADPFAGSGSTLVAAKGMGRRSVGVELDERYCEIAARRLAQDTLFGEAS